MAATKKSTTKKVASAKATTQKIKTAPVAPVAPAKPVFPASPVAASARHISQAEWRSMVEQAAYYIAEKKGFTGNPEEHWADAEAQVRAELAAKNIKVA